MGHEVRVDVVVGDGAVLVGAGHAVDAEGAGGVVVAEVGPQPSRLDQELHAVGLHELVVPGGVVVAQDRVGDRGVDVEGGRARGPVAGALVAGDGPPREGRPGEAEVRSPVPRRRQGRVAPVEGVGGGPGDGEDEDRQHEDLGVPERMAVVARAREPLGGDGPALGPGAGLEEVEHAEAHRVLDLGVAVDLHVGPVPELVEVLPLIGLQAVPSGVASRGDGGGDLVAEGLAGSPRRPAVAEVLDDAQALTRGEHGGDREAGDVRRGVAGHPGRVRPVHLVVHRRGHQELAALGAVDEHRTRAVAVAVVGLGHEGGLEGLGHPGVAAVHPGHRLVGHQLGLHDDPGLLAHRLDLVVDRGGGPVGEGDQPGAAHADALARGRHPLDLPGEGAGAQVEHPLVGDEGAVADVEGLVVDQQPDELAVGHVDQGLARLRVAVAPLGVRQRPLLVDRVEVGARGAERLALVQVPPQAEVAVAEGEHRLAVGQPGQVEAGLPQAPRLEAERGLVHGARSSSRSLTTRSAPAATRASA